MVVCICNDILGRFDTAIVGNCLVIPGNDVWIKLGGDMGGGDFKMNFQIYNTPWHCRDNKPA